MPNWSDDEGRFWWTPPGKVWYNCIQIPHPPVIVEKDCRCEFCEYQRQQKKQKPKERKITNDKDSS